MNVTIYDNEGNEKQSARPKGGIQTEIALMKTIAMNLIIEMQTGNDDIVMSIDLEGASMEQLMEAAKALDRCSKFATS